MNGKEQAAHQNRYHAVTITIVNVDSVHLMNVELRQLTVNPRIKYQISHKFSQFYRVIPLLHTKLGLCVHLGLLSSTLTIDI